MICEEILRRILSKRLAILFEGFPTLRERLRRTDRFANANALDTVISDTIHLRYDIFRVNVK